MEDSQICTGEKLDNHSELSPEDKFFAVLERNLENYINDRPAAYQFIISQLSNFKGKYHFLTAIFRVDETSANDQQESMAQLSELSHQNLILKKGIRI